MLLKQESSSFRPRAGLSKQWFLSLPKGGPDEGEFPMLRISSKGNSFAEVRGTTLIDNS